MPKKYSKELIEYIRQHGSEGTVRDMVSRVSEAFGIEIKYSAMQALFQNHKIHTAPKKGCYHGHRMTTPEMDEFIKSKSKGVGPKEMTEMVNKRFETSFTEGQIKSYYGRNKINSGLTGRFVKGQASYNKGLKQTDYMSPEAIERTKATRFQKGHIPANGGAPVGTIRLRHNHKEREVKPYYWIKTAQPSTWRMYHVFLWEEYNGPVPEGYIVTFADGDTLNCVIDNLILTSRAQNAVKNRWKIKSYDKDSAIVANSIADIKMKQSELRKRRRKKKENP